MNWFMRRIIKSAGFEAWSPYRYEFTKCSIIDIKDPVTLGTVRNREIALRADDPFECKKPWFLLGDENRFDHILTNGKFFWLANIAERGTASTEAIESNAVYIGNTQHYTFHNKDIRHVLISRSNMSSL